jgi:hypothetical protein
MLFNLVILTNTTRMSHLKVTGFCECGNELLGCIKYDEHRLDSQEGICSLDVVTEQNLLTMNGGALVKRKDICDEGFSNVQYPAIGRENLTLLRVHKTSGRPPVIPTATSLGIKMNILMIKVYNILRVPVLIVVRLVAVGKIYQDFKY